MEARTKMTAAPQVSVIIPVYNQERYLQTSLESVLSQSLSDIEVVAIDDGSTDHSLRVLEAYAKEDPRIRIITQANCGVGQARNAGLRAAHGDYVAFLDPDDWYPDAEVLASVHRAAVEHGVSIAGGSMTKWVNGQIDASHGKRNAPYAFSTDGLVDYSEYQFDYGFWRFIYAREFLVSHGIEFPDYRRYQDPPFFVAAMIAARKFYALERTTYVYRVSSGITLSGEKLRDAVRGMTDVLELSAKAGLSRLHRTTIERMTSGYFRDAVLEAAENGGDDLVELLYHANACVDLGVLSDPPGGEASRVANPTHGPGFRANVLLRAMSSPLHAADAARERRAAARARRYGDAQRRELRVIQDSRAMKAGRWLAKWVPWLAR